MVIRVSWSASRVLFVDLTGYIVLFFNILIHCAIHFVHIFKMCLIHHKNHFKRVLCNDTDTCQYFMY